MRSYRKESPGYFRLASDGLVYMPIEQADKLQHSTTYNETTAHQRKTGRQ